MQGPRVYFYEHTQLNEVNEPVQFYAPLMMNQIAHLPRLHEQGDSLSVQENGFTVSGTSQHDQLISRKLRNAARKRITWLDLEESSGTHKIGFCSMPDWSLLEHSDLPFVQPFHAQQKFLLMKWNHHWIHAQSLQTYFVSLFEMIFQSLALEAGSQAGKLSVRLWPLVSKKVVPESILSSVSFCYGSALLTVLHQQVNPNQFAHIQIADFLDIQSEPFLSMACHQMLHQVPITSVKDIPDQNFVDVVPSDTFSLPGLHPNSLEATMTQNTNLHDVLRRPWAAVHLPTLYNFCHGWPTLSGHQESRAESQVGAPLHRPLSYRETLGLGS